MNLQLTGNHIDITPAIRRHIAAKVERATRHTDSITAIHAIISADKMRHKIEVTVFLRGRDVFAEAEDQDLYTAVDLLIDKLERQLSRYKERSQEHGYERISEHLSE